MIPHRPGANHERRVSTGWVILIAGLCLVGSLGCSLARQIEPLVLAAGPRDANNSQQSLLATRTPWPTFTSTDIPSPTPTPTESPTVTPTPTDTATPTNTPVPTETDTPVPAPTATTRPTRPPAPAKPTPTETPTPAPPPTPSFAYRLVEIYQDSTSNAFLTGYIMIVNADDIPIGGVKAVGIFDPGGARHESPLSKWFFEGYSAPGPVLKTSSVKFEPLGAIQKGTWAIHLESEQGVRLSEDVSIVTDPDKPDWFFIEFMQPGPRSTSTPMPDQNVNSWETTETPNASGSVTPSATGSVTLTPQAGGATPRPTATRSGTWNWPY